MNFRADLHTHSTASDGSLSPMELVEEAIKSELNGLSITDHDTASAYKEIKKYVGNFVLPGIEFSCTHNRQSVHVLAYSINPWDERLLRFCKNHKQRRQKRALTMVKNLRSIGLNMPEEKVLALQNIGRPHIAQCLVEQEIVSTFDEAFSKYIGDGKPYYLPPDAPSVEETVQFIHLLNAVPVIAHPHLIKNKTLLKQILQLPFEGIEVWYAKMHPSQEAAIRKIAEEKGWIQTGGSDFHGEVKPQIPIGCSWTREETFTYLMERYHANV